MALKASRSSCAASIGELTQKAKAWEPSDKDELMPALRVDGEDMPRTKDERIKRYQEYEKRFRKREETLGELTPYKPHPSLLVGLLEIWAQK